MERKQLDNVLVNVDEAQGIVKAVFAVMGNVDETKDRIWPGSFAKTFVERGNKVLVLDNHKTDSTHDIIAKPMALRELTRNELPTQLLAQYPDATGGAEITAKFEPDPAKDERSAAAFYRLKNDWTQSWSFGYDALDYDFTTESIDKKDVQVRNLRTIKLYEVSPVLWPANPAAMTTDAKSAPTEDKPYRAVHENGKWRVYKLDADGKPTGKPLGEHDSEDEANAQVRALYANTDAGKSDEPEAEAKSGRILSGRNVERIRDHIAGLQKQIDELNAFLTDAGVMDEDEEATEVTTGPFKGSTAPTSTEAGPQEQPTPVDYLTLIKIQRQKAALWRL